MDTNEDSLSLDHIKRARGCLVGLAIGDAFGGRYEFMKSKDVITTMDQDYKPSTRIIPILGGGVHNLKSGQITDDTEMALCLAESITENGKYIQSKAAQKYVDWLNSNPIDVGSATKNALTISGKLGDVTQEMIHNSFSLNKSKLSNGSMMRIPTLAIHGSILPESIFLQHVENDCRLTHPNNIVVDATKVFANCIRTAIITGDKKLTIQTAFRTAKTKAVQSILNTALEQEQPFSIYQNESDPAQSTFADSDYQGYFGIALHCAIYELANGSSFQRSLERVVSKGGDTDTNGAIVGSLLGATYGIHLIPEEWKESIIKGIQRFGYPYGNHLFNTSDKLLM